MKELTYTPYHVIGRSIDPHQLYALKHVNQKPGAIVWITEADFTILKLLTASWPGS